MTDRTPYPQIEAVERKARELFGFDMTGATRLWPGAVRVWYRTKDKEPGKRQFWPKLRVEVNTLDIVAYEWRVSIDWYPVTEEYGWHESGVITAKDRTTLLSLAESVPGMVKAYRADMQKRKEWPHRGTRFIPGIGTKKDPGISTDQLEAPKKKGKGVGAGMTRDQIKHAWEN